ncbi:MAG TPA: hypothetical protein VF103_15940, partial [Polyangiaceae bacterium]
MSLGSEGGRGAPGDFFVGTDFWGAGFSVGLAFRAGAEMGAETAGGGGSGGASRTGSGAIGAGGAAFFASSTMGAETLTSAG